ncbi:hypothetical protein HPULCUR_004938 [Helicostylum pulchrum]|uniref:Uncharacterized protein n=1 Tax=Helicostylum pulchrum TaxID=562976 RepID=A0ABP9XZQ7_9FUNG
MSNINYDTFHNQLVESPSTYYPTAIPPDPLERYGSGHLDLDIFGISVSRLSNVQQLAFVRKVMTITACQFLTLAFMVFFIVTVCPLFDLGAICLSSTWLRYVYDMDPLEILYPITISSVICSYVILEIYYIMKNVTSDDYLLANVYFFVDLVYPMRFIHHFCELTDNMNMFPEILYPGEIRA